MDERDQFKRDDSSAEAHVSHGGGIVVRNQNSFATLYRLIDLIVIVALFCVSGLFFGIAFTTAPLLLLIISVVSFQISAEAIELYRSWRGHSTFEMLRAVTIVWVVSGVITLTFAFFFGSHLTLLPRLIALWFCLTLLMLLAWRYIMRKILFTVRKSGMNSRDAIIIGATQVGLNVANQIEENEQLGIRFKGLFDDRGDKRLSHSLQSQILGNIEDAIAMAKRNEVDYIYIALPMSAENRIRHILEKCSDTTASVYLVPNFFIYNLLNARWQSIGSVQALSVYDTPFQGAATLLKRIEDIVLSIVILSFLVIPMACIALAIKFTSKGPVIFKQHRYGLDGRPITIYKFRSMTTQDNGEEVKQATKNDPRITKVGAFIRKTSLDELPQFINVLQGRMSIVGPRPHAVAHNEQYRKIIKGYMLRHKVKPGITGLAQVNGLRGETEVIGKMVKRVEYDLDYIHRWSVWLDIKIIAMTIINGFVNKNAY